MPASPPESRAVRSTVAPTGRPAKAAASGLCPTARIWKPQRLKRLKAQVKTANPTAQRKPAWRRMRGRSEEHTSELQSLMRISYAVFCLKKNNKNINTITNEPELSHHLT